MPEHPDADVRGYIYEHRLVAERMLGRRIGRHEHVHHINGDKRDNRPENLEVVDAPTHRLRHRRIGLNRRRPGEPNPTATCACGCLATFPRFDANGRPRRFVPGHNGRVDR
jgi:hypothetical protein